MGSILCGIPAVQRPCSGGPCCDGPCCTETLPCGYSAVQRFYSGRLCCTGTLLQEDPAMCGYPVLGNPGMQKPCVGPYSVKPCYIDTLFRGTLVYRKSAVWGPCCVGILPEGVLLCRASSLRGPCVYRPALQGTIV